MASVGRIKVFINPFTISPHLRQITYGSHYGEVRWTRLMTNPSKRFHHNLLPVSFPHQRAVGRANQQTGSSMQLLTVSHRLLSVRGQECRKLNMYAGHSLTVCPWAIVAATSHADDKTVCTIQAETRYISEGILSSIKANSGQEGLTATNFETYVDMYVPSVNRWKSLTPHHQFLPTFLHDKKFKSPL